MKILLTGDVHHRSLKYPEQKSSKKSELQLALEYLKIAKKYEVKVNLFITGKTFIEEKKKDIDKLLSFSNLEIGGHTYSALRPVLLHYIFKKIYGCAYGPYFYQKRDIEKTLKIIENYTDRKVLSWRTHSYASDENTRLILKKNGVQYISDKINRNLGKVENNNGIIEIPINTLPDHENVIHGRNLEHHNNIILGNNIFYKLVKKYNIPNYQIETWFEKIKYKINSSESSFDFIVLLIHPICMYVSDNFKTFEKICNLISKYRTGLIKEIQKIK